MTIRFMELSQSSGHAKREHCGYESDNDSKGELGLLPG